eukprot:m.23607 g.23607  ORF g.23607 m.23607 type:complete len:179 (+) comp11071_c0_seq3:445-981(+)
MGRPSSVVPLSLLMAASAAAALENSTSPQPRLRPSWRMTAADTTSLASAKWFFRPSSVVSQERLPTKSLFPPAAAAAAAPEAGLTAVPEDQAVTTPETARREQKNKSKCFQCKAKVSLVQQETNKCSCGYVFCDAHRYAENHDCEFDHKGKGRSGIAKQLPKHERAGGRGIHRLESCE